MAVAYALKASQVTICLCVLLPALIAFPDHNQLKLVAHKQRSLNNYVATSVPYIVDHRKNVYLDELSSNGDGATIGLNEKVDDDDRRTTAATQEMLDCVNANHCANGSIIGAAIEGTFKPYSQDELNKILQKYETDDQLEAQESTNDKLVQSAANYYSLDNAAVEPSSNDSNDKSKAWQQQSNKNPYDDRLGWVTLEPIPWSSSQVQKWEPNSKPNWPIPSSGNVVPWGANLRPSSSSPPSQNAYPAFADRPHKKPTYQYDQSKPWSSASNYNNHAKPQFSQHYGNEEIITDGQPGYFPSDGPPSSQNSYKPPWLEHTHSFSYTNDGSRPAATQVTYQGVDAAATGHGYRPPNREPATSSAEGDGHWVLLSSTKGYSAPNRHRNDLGRSLDANAAAANSAGPTAVASVVAAKRQRPMSARRSIRLTVLPSLDGPKATVTSHGGMIERDANDQTVEEAHREHLARMMRFGNSTENEVISRSSSFHGIPAKVEAISRPADRRDAIVKTVSAGVIPATMAVLLPMLLGRRKRSMESQNDSRRYESAPNFDRSRAMIMDRLPF